MRNPLVLSLAAVALAAPLASTGGLIAPGVAAWLAAAAAAAAAGAGLAWPALAPQPETAASAEAAPPPPEAAPEAAPDSAPALRAALARLGAGALSARVSGEGAAEANAALTAAQSALDEALALADLLAAGDLSVKGSTAHPGAFRDLMTALDGVAAGLRVIVGAIARASDDIAARAEGLTSGADKLSLNIGVQVEALSGARAAGEALRAAVASVGQGAGAGEAAAVRAAQVAREGMAGAAEASAAITRVEERSRQIAQVLESIDMIARQTKLLGVNAAVEAARAGDVGRGFAVVAAEVQALADRTAESARSIAREIAESDAAVAGCAGAVRASAAMLGRIAAEVDAVTGATGAIRQACAAQTEALAEALGRIGAADDAARQGEHVAAAARDAARGLDAAVGGLRARLSGVMLEDDSMEEAVRARAAEVSRLFEDGVRSGRITMAALFSADYAPVPGSNPPQFAPPFVAFTDAVLPPVLEGALRLGENVVFCAAVNRDGFLPTHNRKFSQAQGPDPVKNAALSRNRRFFDDRVGLAAGRSTAPFLIQAYRRDMGGGAFATMKDISAPIIVQGRHWGGLRIGYRAETVRLGLERAA